MPSHVADRSVTDYQRHLLGEPLFIHIIQAFPLLIWAIRIAEKWNFEKAVSRLEKNLMWRRAMGVYDVEGMAKSLEEVVSSYLRQFAL